MNNRNNSKITVVKLFLGIVYLTLCSFIFLLLAGVAIDFIFDDPIDISKEWLLNISVGSSIIGIAAGSGSWIFVKIDEHKARKSPPSDPE